MKEIYAKIFSQYPAPSMLLEPVDGEWIIRNVNEKYCEVTGRKPAGLIGHNIAMAFPENSAQESKNWQMVEASLEKVLQTGKGDKISEIRYDIFNAENGVFEQKYWMAENYPILADDEARVEFILHTATDRTAEVLEQNRLKMEVERAVGEQKHFIDANPDGLYSLDINGKFLSFNAGLTNILDTTDKELRSMDFLPFIAPHQKERILSHFEKTLQGQPQKFEADIISATGRHLELSFSIVPIQQEEEVRGVFGIARDVTESRRSKDLIRQKEREIQKSESKYKALVQEAFDLIGVLDAEANFIFASDSTTHLLGIRPEEFIGKNAFDFIHPEDKERVLKDFLKIEVQKKIKIAPFRFKDADENWRWFETNVTNMTNDPDVEGVVINSREVTDVIIKSRELHQLYERYELAVAATGDLIYDWDLETDTVKRFFKGKEKRYGYEKEEVDRRHFWREHIHPEEREGLRKLLRNILKDPGRDQIRTQYRFKRADGTYAHLIDRGMIMRDKNGKALRMIGATSDISGLVNRRNALRLANKRFAYAMKATQEMIWDWDFVNNTIERSKSFEKIIGPQKVGQSSPDQSWFEKIDKNDQPRVKESLNRALADPEVTNWKEEYKVIQLNGEKAYMIDRAYIIRNSMGEVIRMVGATLDVSESRRMLKAIKKQNRILKEVAWEQAHVVRAPIARLKGLLNLFDEDYNGEWEKEEILQLIKDSTEELDNIVINIIRKTEGIEIDG